MLHTHDSYVPSAVLIIASGKGETISYVLPVLDAELVVLCPYRLIVIGLQLLFAFYSGLQHLKVQMTVIEKYHSFVNFHWLPYSSVTPNQSTIRTKHGDLHAFRR